MSDKKPCPFCGGEAEILTFWDFYKFSCRNADCTAHVADAPYVQHAEGVWYGSIDEARAAWNTRAERTCKNLDNDADCFFCCSVCGSSSVTEFLGSGDGVPRYCPSCGAKVVGE